MPTKTEYRGYIASEEWQQRRKHFLRFDPDCEECGLPRWLAIIAYDQDLHVHHKCYGNLGCEKDEDLEPLCRRCHEIKTFGTSTLHAPQKYECQRCGETTFDARTRLCSMCEVLLSLSIKYCPSKIFFQLYGPEGYEMPVWAMILDEVRQALELEYASKADWRTRAEENFEYALTEILKQLSAREEFLRDPEWKALRDKYLDKIVNR